MPLVSQNWIINQEKMNWTNNAAFMHCLPVRRNVELPDELLDGPRSLVHQQAENRIYSAQIVLKKMLETQFGVIEEQMKALQTQVL